jgi:hypothetical protein
MWLYLILHEKTTYEPALWLRKSDIIVSSNTFFHDEAKPVTWGEYM